MLKKEYEFIAKKLRVIANIEKYDSEQDEKLLKLVSKMNFLNEKQNLFDMHGMWP
ncbi:MAG: hypothetical protein ACFFAN_12105 [Promethearchaeota archaeon]